jgi:hypothetical protein
MKCNSNHSEIKRYQEGPTQVSSPNIPTLPCYDKNNWKSAKSQKNEPFPQQKPPKQAFYKAIFSAHFLIRPKK